MDIELRSKIKGRFRLEILDGESLNLKRRLEFDNMILDSGLEAVPFQSVWGCAQVGASNVAPNPLQTRLISWIAGTRSSDYLHAAPATPPDYPIRLGRKFRFGTGEAAGNLSEVGVGWDVSGDTLWSRALIVDEGGQPTTITVLPTEILDVYYYMDVYPEVEDYEFQIEIRGVLHDCVLRWSEVTNWTNSWFLSSGTASATVHSGPIGPITGAPSGLSSGHSSVENIPYSANSRYLDRKFTWGINVGNFEGGIQSARFYWLRLAVFQCSFSPPIAKTSLDTLTLTFRASWDRY